MKVLIPQSCVYFTLGLRIVEQLAAYVEQVSAFRLEIGSDDWHRNEHIAEMKKGSIAGTL
jgi:hypothetical protein